MNEKLKEGIKTWLWFDFFLAVIMYAHLGTEGMAKLACEVVDHEICADLEYPS